MSENRGIEELVSSSLKARQSLVDVLRALQNFHNFSNLFTQLDALQTVLVHLPQVTALQNSEFDNFRSLLQNTSKFCVDIRKDLERMAQSESTDWPSLKCLGYDVDSLTQRLKLYTTSLAIGAMHAANSTGDLYFTEEAKAELRTLISETTATAERNLESIAERIIQLETGQNKTVEIVPKSLP